ncbi:hypothetical protein [Salinisphaera sp. T31B1]|uniref:hypothetical protein n=1 Tax=Salinisphaera sp. T31B1 TaxID=727963 RepID=UPI00334147E8
MVKVDVPCPECSQTPVTRLDLIEGEIWICMSCGHQEIIAGVDIEAQLDILADHDPQLVAGWREALGI